MITHRHSFFFKVQYLWVLIMITVTAHSLGEVSEAHPQPSASVIGLYHRGCEPIETLMDNLGLTHIRVPTDFSPHHIRRKTSVIVLPVNSASSIWQSECFRLSLDLFVRQLGGTLICLVQNRSELLQVLPVPHGENDISGFGFREMHSAYYLATENIAVHPVLAGLNNDHSQLNFDGYFTGYPADSEILITNRNNGYPVLLTYPCENGRVIITSLTMGIGMEFGSSDEARLAANILAYSLDGDSMPEFILDITEPVNEISEELQMVNTTNRFGSYAEITLLSPDRIPIDKYRQDLGRDLLHPGETDYLNLKASIEREPGVYWFDVHVFEQPGHEITALHDDFRVHVSTRPTHRNPEQPAIDILDHGRKAKVYPCAGQDDPDMRHDIAITDCPDIVTGLPGEVIELPFQLTNEGVETQTFEFRVCSGDLFSWCQQVTLEPGQTDLIQFEGTMPDDLSPHGITVIRYFLNDCQCGTIRLNVPEFPVNVEALLDPRVSHPGDTVDVRFKFTDLTTSEIEPVELLLHVFHGNWQKWQNIVLDKVQTEIEIPVPINVAVDTIHYVVCLESGRVLEKGKLPVQLIYPEVEVYLDKPDYDPGDTMILSISANEPGTLQVVTPWSSEVFHADKHVKILELHIPEELFEGKRHVRYTMGGEWRSIPFIINNTCLKITNSALYLPNENFISGDIFTITSEIISTKAETVKAVVRVGLPSGESGAEIARKTFNVEKDIVNYFQISAQLTSRETGPHDIFTDFYIDGSILTGFHQVLDVGPGKIVSIDPFISDIDNQTRRFNTEIFLFGQGEGEFTMDFGQWRITDETVSLNGLKRLVYNLDIPDNPHDIHEIKCQLEFSGVASKRSEQVTFPASIFRQRRSNRSRNNQSPGSGNPVLVSTDDYNQKSLSSADDSHYSDPFNEHDEQVQAIPSVDYRGLILLLIGIGILITRQNHIQ